MTTGELVSIGEYLSTDYSPDCDYVDGVVEERNLGEYDHARLQAKLTGYFLQREEEWGIRVVPEQRVQVSPTRFRIPDVCVVLGEPDGQIFRKPPFICIEVQSPEDRVAKILQRIDDYIAFGVPYIFLLDPQTQRAYRCTSEGMHEVKELRTKNPEMLVPLAALFES